MPPYCNNEAFYSSKFICRCMLGEKEVHGKGYSKGLSVEGRNVEVDKNAPLCICRCYL